MTTTEATKDLHTPGPWEASGKGGTGPRWNIFGRRGDRPALVCQVNVSASGEERAANAQLIAAAPELLAACEELVADMLSHASLGLNESEVAMLKRAEAAIAKARGAV